MKLKQERSKEDVYLYMTKGWLDSTSYEIAAIGIAIYFNYPNIFFNLFFNLHEVSKKQRRVIYYQKHDSIKSHVAIILFRNLLSVNIAVKLHAFMQSEATIAKVTSIWCLSCSDSTDLATLKIKLQLSERTEG